MSTSPKAYTTAQACALLAVNKWKLYRMEDAGTIRSIQPSGPGTQKLWVAAPIDAIAHELDPSHPKPKRIRGAAWRDTERKRSA